MEIEAKFRVAHRRVFATLLRLPTLAGATLTPHLAPESQRTTYFDTPADELRAQRVSLRVREIGGQRIATVKRSHGAVGAIHMRDEWEVPVGLEPHPLHWPPSAARGYALALLGPSPLIARVHVHTRRSLIDVHHGDRTVAELCLDEGYVAAGGRIAGFRELEVELMPAGTGADLDQLCAALMARFPIEPEPTGKRARGLALLDAVAERHGMEATLELAPG
jgi:inorganic triphosphatase YgiF